MPRYFFNIFHDRTHIDPVGEELPDKHAAWAEATRAAGTIIRDIDGGLRPGHDWRMEVTDEFQNPLWEIHVKAEKK
ncbi:MULTISPECIES: hypothetical protein [unclassified Afipia]|uniref:DUF6894 family protein n=1 Tax=unclassified Afipia TaxID=2642050 RepID=UPI0004142B44|nr:MULTISPECIES: hypothetical protein [unclassified Afipia]